MFCEKCGKELKAGDAFCWACGTPIPDADDIEEEVEKNIAETVTEIEPDEPKSVIEQTDSNNTSTVDKQTSGAMYNNSNYVIDNRIRIGKVSSEFNQHRENNRIANGFKLVGWLVITIGVLIGFVLLIMALTKSGSSSSYSAISSAFSGLGSWFAIGTIIISVISGMGFLGIAEIIQLLQDQKTILIRQNLRNNTKKS